MKHTSILRRQFSALGLAVATLLSGSVHAQAQYDGSAEQPLRVILIPADGGTADGTIGDFQPIFSAIEQGTDLHFDLKVGQSYSSVVEAMCNGAADIAWFGPASYLQAHARGCAELLALAVRNNESVYYSGIFANADTDIQTLEDVAGKRMALGDVNSTSSFNVPLAMLIDQGLDPARDLGSINMAGSHSNVLSALAEGLVDVGGASFDSFEKAVNSQAINPGSIRVIAKSQPIPYPPLAIHPDVDADIKQRLRDSFNNIHTLPGISKEQIRGYGGAVVDGYTAEVSEAEMASAGAMFELVTDAVRQQVVNKASQR